MSAQLLMSTPLLSRLHWEPPSGETLRRPFRARPKPSHCQLQPIVRPTSTWQVKMTRIMMSRKAISLHRCLPLERLQTIIQTGFHSKEVCPPSIRTWRITTAMSTATQMATPTATLLTTLTPLSSSSRHSMHQSNRLPRQQINKQSRSRVPQPNLIRLSTM